MSNNIFIRIRKRIGARLLKQRLVFERKMQLKPLADIRSALIVADISNDGNDAAVRTLKNDLKRICPNARVDIFCYYDVHSRQDTSKLISDQSTEYLSSNGLNFFFLPKDRNVVDNLAKIRDISFALIDDADSPLILLNKAINSSLRIGPRGLDDENFDIMVEVPNGDMFTLVKQIAHYIEIIKSKN